MLDLICLTRETGSSDLSLNGDVRGSTKSLLCVCIFRATTSGGKGLSADLVLYVQALQNPIGVPLGAAQLSLDVLNHPVAVASCQTIQPEAEARIIPLKGPKRVQGLR